MSVPFLKDIFVYPIKSCRGYRLDTCAIDAYGLVNDRRYLVTDLKGVQRTAREFPRMVLIEPRIVDGELLVEAPNHRTLRVPGRESVITNIVAWDDMCEAMDCGEEAAEWFSRYLGVPCRLVKMHAEFKRPVDAKYRVRDAQVTFADAYPFLMLSTASVDDLSKRVRASMVIERFRPNLVVTHCEAYAEDSWQTIQMGEITFYGVKRCSRCVLTTVDPETAEPGKEPLSTLSSYRKNTEGKVLFGQNVICEQTSGVIRAGEKINIISVGTITV